MIKTHIFSAAAVLAFGFAFLSGPTVAVAAPAGPETGTAPVSGSASEPRPDSKPGTGSRPGADSKHGAEATPGSGDRHTATPALETSGNRFAPTKHPLFPTAPHSPHEGQGHKGDKEQHATPPRIWAVPGLDAPAAG